MGDVKKTAPSMHRGPTFEGKSQRGSFGLLIALAIILLTAGVMLAYLPPDTASSVVFILLTLFALIGTLFLFATAIGFVGLTNNSGVPSMPEKLANGLTDGLLVTDISGRIDYANPAYCLITGVERPLDACTIDRLFSSDPDASEALFDVTQNLRNGQMGQKIVRLPLPLNGQDNQAHWYKIQAQGLEDPLSAIGPGNERILWRLSDITDERADQELSYQELQKAINFMDQAPVGFFSTAQDGKIAYLNATLARWLDYDLAQFDAGGLRLRDILRDDDEALVLPASGGGSETRANTIDVDLIKKTGQSLPVRLYHDVPRSEDNTLGDSRTVVVAREANGPDEDPLIALQIRFARFFNSSPIAIATTDRKGIIRAANGSFARLFFSAAGEDSIGKTNLLNLVVDLSRDTIETAFRHAIAGKGEIEPVEALLVGRDERSAQFFFSAIPDNDDRSGGDENAMVHVLETTGQRILERQFAQSQKMQAVGQLAGGVAHDFNNVLTAIIGFSDLLLASHKQSDPAFQDINNIRQNANRAAGLVRQLLAFSRRQTLRPIKLDLNEVLAELTVMLDRLLTSSVSLKLIHSRDLWPVMADLNQFETVIINLAVNARDAMEGEKGTVTISTRNITEEDVASLQDIPGMPPAEYVLVEVTDEGSGMPPDVVEKVFEPFFSTKEVGKGTGLGLSTVYGIIKQSDGFIYPYSTLGEGTVFRIYLPRHVPEIKEGQEDETQSHVQSAKDVSGSGVILLVEDEEAVRAFGARALKARGYTVYEAASGAEAMEFVNGYDGDLDLVVSDVVMPEMDGPTLLGHLRQLHPDLKIIFVSGYAEDAFEKNLPENEKFTFLSKPFSLKQLATVVKDTIDTE